MIPEDKYLPNQKFYKNLSKLNTNQYNIRLYNHIRKCLDLNNTKMKFTETNKVTLVEMASDPLMLNITNFLINLFKPKKILEIGTFMGVFSCGVAKNHFVKKVTTIEKFKEFYDLAKVNIKKNNLEKKIELHNGDAFDVLNKLKNKKYDLIFLDGDKGNYLRIFKKIEKNNLKKNSVIIVDDIFFHGDIFNKFFINKKTKGVSGFMKYIKNKENYYKTILPIFGGVMCLQKK